MQHATILAAIHQAAADIPDRVAFRTPGRNWTFADVDNASRCIARGLLSLGIGRGDRVAALTRHMAEATVLMLGASRIGAVCCPVNWRLAQKEIEYVVQHSEAKFALVDADFLPTWRQLSVPSVGTTSVTEGTNGDSGFAGWFARFSPIDEGDNVLPGDTALQLYSSGTTGLPKGVELTHRNLVGLCETVGRELKYPAEGSVTLNALPTFHIGGFGLAVAVLCNRGTAVTYPDFQPARVIPAFAEHGITHTFFVPAMIHALLQVPGVENADFSSLKLVAYGASPITEKVLVDALRVFKCAFVQNYGLTETTGPVVTLPPEDHDPGGPRGFLLRSAGRPVAGAQVRIVDTTSGKDLPDGEVGEVWISSGQNMKSYWRNEKATLEAYPEGPDWFRSGDAGYLRDGYLFIQDRIKDLIISGGENIYPIEVENALMQHPAVGDCAVIAVPDEKWGESVKACVVAKPGVQVSAEEIIGFVRERIAHYKCPRTVDFLDDLPRNPSGKVLKKVLREPYWKAVGRSVN